MKRLIKVESQTMNMKQYMANKHICDEFLDEMRGFDGLDIGVNQKQPFVEKLIRKPFPSLKNNGADSWEFIVCKYDFTLMASKEDAASLKQHYTNLHNHNGICFHIDILPIYQTWWYHVKWYNDKEWCYNK